MDKKRLSIVLAMLFLAQVTAFPETSYAETASLADTKLPSNCFRQLYSILYVALSIYKSDTIKGYSKEAIKDEFSGSFFNREVRFDLERIDIGKKGWTRYYPFSVGKEHFIVRIFLTEELAYQSKAPVLFEASIVNPAVTAQVLPGINDIIKDCRIRPYTFSPVSQTERSP